MVKLGDDKKQPEYDKKQPEDDTLAHKAFNKGCRRSQSAAVLLALYADFG